MSLIFDTFPAVEHARAFQAEVKKRFGLDGQVFEDAAAAQQHDPFPWEQVPPIVHIDRVHCAPQDTSAITARFSLTAEHLAAVRRESAMSEDNIRVLVAAERRITDLVKEYGGVFAGT
jgi:hypothetical protein